MENIPLIGLGLYKVNNEEIKNIIKPSLKIGYRHFDTANLYKNEESLYNEISEYNEIQKIENNEIKRSEIWITTKIDKYSIYYNKTKSVINNSLNLIQKYFKIDNPYLDLILLHCNINDKLNNQAWLILEEFYKEGKIKYIGLSNYSINNIEKLQYTIKPYCNQIELSPLLQRKNLVEYCKNKNIIIIAYSSLINGIFNENNEDNKKIKKSKEQLEQISQKYNITIHELLLLWAKKNNFIVIPNSLNIEHLKQNFDICNNVNIHINDQDIEKINKLDCGYSLFPKHCQNE